MDKTIEQRLASAKAAVAAAVKNVDDTDERSPSRLARGVLAQAEHELRDAEQAIARATIEDVTAEIRGLLAQKAQLLAQIKRQLETLVPVLVQLDTLEVEGAQRSQKLIGLQVEHRSAPVSLWRDPVLAGCADLARRWLQRLEG